MTVTTNDVMLVAILVGVILGLCKVVGPMAQVIARKVFNAKNSNEVGNKKLSSFDFTQCPLFNGEMTQIKEWSEFMGWTRASMDGLNGKMDSFSSDIKVLTCEMKEIREEIRNGR